MTLDSLRRTTGRAPVALTVALERALSPRPYHHRASARGSGGKLRVMLRDAVGDFLNGDAQMLLRDDTGREVPQCELAPL